MTRFACLMLLAAGCSTAEESDTNDTEVAAANPLDWVVPIDGSQNGKTYSDQAAAWWQWELAATRDMLPSSDPDGRLAANGQPADFWFLAGTTPTMPGTGEGTVVRTVTIPADRPIFFPILDTVWATFPGIDPPFSDPGAEQAARDAIAMVGDETLTLVIDGVSVPNLLSYRAQSAVFSITMPEYNFWDGPDPVEDDYLAGGTYPECVADGYWMMLEPLPAGAHEIHFTSAFTRGDTYSFALDATYNLTISN